jgi:hypothetical protein
MPFLSAEIMQGTFAGIPAFGSAGRIYFATDTGQTFYDSGSAWVDVSDAGVVTSVAGRAGAVTLAESDIASLTADLAAKATTTRTIGTTAPLTGGGDLSADITLAISVFGASGGSHATGAVPDPGSSAGATRFLCENATFSTPSGGSAALTTKGDLLGFDTVADRVPIGSNGQVLTADSTQALGLKWAPGSLATLTTKGDLLGFDSAVDRIPIGSDTQVLTADSTQSLGLKWAPAVSSYSGSADAVAGDGQNTVTLGSTPITNSWKVFLNGVLMPITVLSISGAVITYTGTWTAGDLISATWATTNSTPGGITLGSTNVTIRGTNFVTSGTSIAFPVGTAVGDSAVLFLSSTSASQTIPSGWASQFNASVTFWSGAVATKTLTSTDIAAGSVTFSGSVITGIVTLIGAPTLMEVKAVSGASNTTPVSLTTTGSASASYTALYFGSNIATGTNSVNRGTLDQSGNNGTNAGMLYTEILGSSGTVSATFSYSSGNAKNFDAIVVLQTTTGAAGTLPEIQQSQVIGLPTLASSVVTTLTTTGSGAATLTGNTLNVPTANPMTTAGDIIYGGSSGTPTRLAGGTSTFILTSNGPTSAPSWQVNGGGGAALTLETDGAGNGSQSTLNLIGSGLTLSDDGSGDVTIGYNCPALASFSWVNQGSATAVQTVSGGPIFMKIPDTAALNWRGLFVNQPSTPYKLQAQITAALSSAGGANSQDVGIYFYNGTKLMGLEVLSQAGGFTPRVEKITNVTTDSGSAASTFALLVGSRVFSGTIWIQLRNSGTTLSFDYSLDGVNYTNAFSEAVGTFITPTQIGFGGISVVNNAAYSIYNNLLNWRTIANATL